MLNSLKHCCNDHSCCDQYVHHTRCVLGDKKYYPAYRYFSDYGACTARYMRGEAWACASIDAPRPATDHDPYYPGISTLAKLLVAGARSLLSLVAFSAN